MTGALARIASEVAAEHGLTLDELRAADRARRISWPRQDAMRRQRDETSLSTTQIGAFWGRAEGANS